MAKKGERITNSRTGQIMIFLKTGEDTNGELLEIECFSPHSKAQEPEHMLRVFRPYFEAVQEGRIF